MAVPTDVKWKQDWWPGWLSLPPALEEVIDRPSLLAWHTGTGDGPPVVPQALEARETPLVFSPKALHSCTVHLITDRYTQVYDFSLVYTLIGLPRQIATWPIGK